MFIFIPSAFTLRESTLERKRVAQCKQLKLTLTQNATWNSAFVWLSVWVAVMKHYFLCSGSSNLRSYTVLIMVFTMQICMRDKQSNCNVWVFITTWHVSSANRNKPEITKKKTHRKLSQHPSIFAVSFAYLNANILPQMFIEFIKLFGLSVYKYVPKYMSSSSIFCWLASVARVAIALHNSIKEGGGNNATLNGVRINISPDNNIQVIRRFLITAKREENTENTFIS